MSTDPFDEAPHDHSANHLHRPMAAPSPMRVYHSQNPSIDANTGQNVFAALAATSPTASQKRAVVTAPNVAEHDPHNDTAGSVPAAAVLHRRGMSTDHSALASADTSRTALDVRHGRSRTTEMDDHMVGSIYAPHEECPKCKCPRSSSVYCPVSRLHHGDDSAMPEVKEVADDKSAPPVNVAPDAPLESPPAPKKKGWSLFKSKEEKALLALEAEEEEARRRLWKSKSNVEGEHFSRETLRNIFMSGLEHIVKFEKSAGSTTKLEQEKRHSIESSEESEWKSLAKDAEKHHKKVLKKTGGTTSLQTSPPEGETHGKSLDGDGHPAALQPASLAATMSEGTSTAGASPTDATAQNSGVAFDSVPGDHQTLQS